MIKKTQLSDLNFPETFYWGSATSPTQVEGCTCNEWADFVARDGRNADEGCDVWADFEKDFLLLEQMGLNSFRLGLDWGRLQPAAYAELDSDVVSRYREMLDWLVSRDIEPFVTLFHFACPKWLAELGGWTNPKAPEMFADFVRKVAALKLPVKFWITVNEPGVYLTMSYLIGIFPPHQRFAPLQAWRAFRGLVRGHHLARQVLREADNAAQVGIAKHFKYFMPYRRWHPFDRLNAWLCKYFFTLHILEAFLQEKGKPVGCDFIGVNFYGRMRVKGFGDISPVSGTPPEQFERLNSSCDDMWEQDPQWLERLLPSLTRRYHLPLFITESGFATDNEELRLRLFQEHIHSMHTALQAGADIRGFFYWSLTDNFEWAEGYTKKFGLAGVDFTTTDRPRFLRPVADAYSTLSRNTTRRRPPPSAPCPADNPAQPQEREGVREQDPGKEMEQAG